MPAKTGNALLAQLQEMSASNAVVSATGPTNVALVVTEIAGDLEIHTEGGAAADQEAVAADPHPAVISKEEAAVIPETMADQKNSRRDAASFARRRDTSSVIALSKEAEVAIGSREAEVATEEVTGISDAADAIQEVVPLAEETMTGTKDGDLHHAPLHVASVSTQDRGPPLRADRSGTPPATWTDSRKGAPATNEFLSEMASPSPPIY